MIGYDAASRHGSETGRLLPTNDLKGTSSPRRVPPIVRRENVMLDTGLALHIVLGESASFLRDSIKRVAISGIILLGVMLGNGVEGLDAIRKTYNNIPLRVNHVPSD